MKWRWDQGRLDYFQLDEIRRLAKALVSFHGHGLPRGDEPDTLRVTLEAFSDRPFLPEDYKVWRNYKRVFGCQLLATELQGVVFATDLCKQMANEQIDGDDYLIHVVRHFYYPSPVFEDYLPQGPQVFVMCAIVKLLVSNFVEHTRPSVSIDEIVSRLKGNNVDGMEPLARYGQLSTTNAKNPSGSDELRQIREMLRFLSQLSFLKWDNPNLYLDVASKDAAIEIATVFTPSVLIRHPDPAQELLQLGGAAHTGVMPEAVESETLSPNDREFTEGNRVRVVHLRIERSSKLKELYFNHASKPHECDMCEMDTQKRYPWANRLVELHHLLPLSSPVRVESKSTSLRDIVGLCPSCHRATHKFYSGWLRETNQKDFGSYAEAKNVYDLAREAIVL